jgi:predicted dehydrogenase
MAPERHMPIPAAAHDRGVTRRAALKAAGIAAGWTIVPRAVLGGPGQTPPGDRVTLACVGVGSQGLRVMMDFLKHDDVQVVAVCDVNAGSDDYSEWGRHELRDKVRALIGSPAWKDAATYRGGIAGLAPAREVVNAYYASKTRSGAYNGCGAEKDYRQLLTTAAGVDAVVIGTPDHLHAPVAVAAMKAGKHVFCQKPMSHSIAEAQRMAEVSHQMRVATQVAVGNQASEATRQLCEWVWSGAIGGVREVVNWSDRPYWPQGIARPDSPEAVPAHLDWNLWLGPAPERPYHSAYQPFVWRGWRDFGAGAIGDMGCYSFDTIFRVLKLESPTFVEASSAAPMPETFPRAEIIHFHFPSRGDLPAVRVTWYDGGLRPPRPSELGDEPLAETGLMFVGERGTILCGFNGSSPRLIPAARMTSFTPPPPTLPRSPGNDREWLAACKGGPAGGANFGFSARVTETILLGNIAARTGERLIWDGHARRVTNSDAANQHLGRVYRPGWEI